MGKGVTGLRRDPWERIRSGAGNGRGHLLRVTLTRSCIWMSKLLFLKICPLWPISHSPLGMNGFDLAVCLYLGSAAHWDWQSYFWSVMREFWSWWGFPFWLAA